MAPNAHSFTPPETIAVPAATVRLRNARTDSSRKVDLLPFQIGRTPVTVGEYAALIPQGVIAAGEDAVPMHPVTWFAAAQWCNLASTRSGLTPAYDLREREVVWNLSADGFRLPTEAEWETSCRAGAGEPRYGPLVDIAWTEADQVLAPQPVAKKQPNSYGVYDMLGNVWEWCWDFADTGRYGDYRSLRGGGWADAKWNVRASVRRGSAPDAVLEDVGFRVARGPVGTAGQQIAQGWSAEADKQRAGIRGPLPIGWTPHRDLLD